MSILIYDTHKFITKMTKAGMPQPQAEVLAESHVELMETTLATKQDLKDLKAELTGEMKDLEGRLNSEMKNLRGEMKDLKAELTSKIDKAIIKIIGTITAVMVGLAAIMPFLKF